VGQKDKVNSQFIKEIENLKPHEHLCQIYDTPEEWKAAVTTFLITGLRQGEKCSYVVDTHTADQVRAESERGVAGVLMTTENA